MASEPLDPGREVAELLAGMGVATRVDPNLAARQREALLRHLDAVRAAAFTVEEFAGAAGVDVATVERQIAERALWAFDDGPLIAGWELHDGAPLRGLAVVVPRIPSSMSPLGVDRMLTLPSVDLVIDGENVSVVTWLRSGGDPHEAAAVIGSPAELT